MKSDTEYSIWLVYIRILQYLYKLLQYRFIIIQEQRQMQSLLTRFTHLELHSLDQDNQIEQDRFRTPEKNRSKPCNYGPSKKKMKTFNDQERIQLKNKLPIAVKLSFWQSFSQWSLFIDFFLQFSQILYNCKTSISRNKFFDINMFFDSNKGSIV